ncbi:MAG: disulfide bond formation protein B [Rhizobiaceae bacterium]
MKNWFSGENLGQSGPAQTVAAGLVLLGMVVTIGSALAFEHIGGFAPCALCLEQRVPYYWGMPLVALGLIFGWLNWPGVLVRLMLLAGLICLLATIYLGIYHSGVEWGFFEAPESCAAGFSATSSDAGSLLESLATAKPPSCADAAGRFLGLSFAGWNVVAASVLAAIALRGAFGSPNLSSET